MAQISIPLIQGADSPNSAGAAFDSRAAQLEQERAQKEKQRDADFHTVVKYASDGLTNEAKYFAQQKGIQVPDAVYKNADFAKGMAIAGDLYDDPVSAQKFTTAYVSTQGDMMSRYNSALAAGGKPMSKTDRDIMAYTRKLQAQQQYGKSDSGGQMTPYQQAQIDIQNRKLSQPPISRYEAVTKAMNSSLQGGLASKNDVMRAGEEAGKLWDAQYGTQNQSQNPNAGAGNPAINTPVDQIQPVIMDGGGNMSAPQQQGSPRLAPPQAPQAQLPSGMPQGTKMTGKTKEGYSIYTTPDGRKFYDDGKPTVQTGSVQMNNNVTDTQSSPAMIEIQPEQQIPRSPVDRPVITQQNGMNILMPQSKTDSGVNRFGTTYQSVNPNDSRVNAAIKYADNLANIPSHLRVAGGVVGDGLSMAGSGVSKGLTGYLGSIDEMSGAVGNYLSSPVAGNLIKMVGTNGDTVYVYERDLPYAQSIGYQQTQ